MLLIYYNPNKNSFYIKKVHSFTFDKKVGDINQFNHILVQCLFIYKHKFINCIDYWDFVNKTREKRVSNMTKRTNKLIDNTIDLLYKLKRR